MPHPRRGAKMAKFIAVSLLMLLSWAFGILVFIKGWGLQVENWGWLIFGYIATLVIYGVMQGVLNDN